MKTIGIQKELSTIRDYLKDNGYKTYEIDTTNLTNSSALNQFDAIVLSGVGDNFMGFDNTETKVPVINADGLTPVEVGDELKRTL